MLSDEFWSKLGKILLREAIKRNSLKGNADMDWGLHKYRHLVKNAFVRLKQYCAVATRYDKLKKNYKSMVAMACGYLWLPV